MPKVPWISQVSGTPDPLNFLDARDTGQAEDSLGSVVEVDRNGLAVARVTRWTDARQETTDDN